MSSFQFNLIYARDIVKKHEIITEFMFLHPEGHSFMMYNGDSFAIVNRGSTFNLNGFNHLVPTEKYDPIIFHTLAAYGSRDGVAHYLVLREGIMKFYDSFNMQYGTNTTSLQLAMSSDEVNYKQFLEEIDENWNLYISDWRLL